MIIKYILLILSVLMETGKNIFSNDFSKNTLKNDTDIYKFNTFTYLGALAVLMFAGKSSLSAFTAIMAVVFAVIICGAQIFLLLALKCGSMSLTNFILGVNMVIPIIYNVIFYDEKVSLFQVILLAVVIFAIFVSLNVKTDKINARWLVLTLVATVFTGFVGVIQTVHQASPHSSEIVAFLRLTFLFDMLFSAVCWRVKSIKEPSTFVMDKKPIFMAAVSGVFLGLIHIINLYLSGVLPKIVFFPIANGGLIFATLIAAVIFFKEKLSKKQWVALVLGIIALSILDL